MKALAHSTHPAYRFFQALLLLLVLLPAILYFALGREAVLQTLLGRDISPMEERKIVKARLHGFGRYPVKNHVFPAMIRQRSTLSESEVHGILLPSFSPLEMSLLDWFESDDYDRRDVQVFSLVGTNEEEVLIDAQAYVWREELIPQLDLSKEWSYQNFCDNDLEWYLRETVQPCREEMVRLGMTSN